jgi:hypothetical protein
MKCKIINDQVVTRYVLHEFTVGDTDNIEVYLRHPLREWEQTPAGKFCMDKATEITYHTTFDQMTYAHRVAVTGYLSGKNATFWELKKT